MEAAKRLCGVAVREGVRLLAGVGLNAYGGVYYEGESPQSLKNHLTGHPQLYGLDAAGKKMVLNFGVCGPKPVTMPAPLTGQPGVRDRVAPLVVYDSAELGGVQMETGDTGVCQCPRCRDRREHPGLSFSWEDMAMMYPIAVEAIRPRCTQCLDHLRDLLASRASYGW